MKNKLLVIFFAFTLITTLGAPQPAHAGGVTSGVISLFSGALDAVGNLINNTIAIASGLIQGTINLVVGGSFSDGYKQGFCSIDNSIGSGYGLVSGGGCDSSTKYWRITSSSDSNGNITPEGTTIVEQGKDVKYRIISGPVTEVPLALPSGCIEVMIPTHSKISNVFLRILGIKSAVAATTLALPQNGLNCVQHYKFVHETGWVVASVTVDGVPQVVPQNVTTFDYTFSSVSADHTISATFALASTPPVVVVNPLAVCGTANGVAVSDTPSTNLCTTTSSPSEVVYACDLDPDGDGSCVSDYYYSWNCSGSGLTTAYCTAPYTAPATATVSVTSNAFLPTESVTGRAGSTNASRCWGGVKNSANTDVGNWSLVNSTTTAVDPFNAGTLSAGNYYAWFDCLNSVGSGNGPATAPFSVCASGQTINVSGVCTTPVSYFTLTVGKVGAGTVNSTIPNTNIACGTGANCIQSYASGTQVTLTATPDNGNVFTSWTGCDEITSDNKCKVTVVNPGKTVVATFTVLSDPAFSISATSPVLYGAASTLTLTSSNVTACSLVEGSTVLSDANPVSLNTTDTRSTGPLTSSKTYSFQCRNAEKLGDWKSATVTVCTNGQTIDVNGVCTTPVSYFTLSVGTAGTGTGQVTGSGITCTRSSGTTSGTCSVSLASGTSVTLPASSTDGSTISWTGCDEITSDNKCKVTVVNPGKTVVATFDMIPSTMSGTLSITPSPCIINVYESTCNVNLSWTVTNPEGKSSITSSNPSGFDYNGASDPPSFNTVMPIVGEHNPTSFYLYNNSKRIDQKDVVVVCVAGTSWNDSYCAPTAPTTYTLSVGTSGSGTGTVTGSGINCTRSSGTTSGTCVVSLASGTSPVTLTAAPVGSTVTWSGCTGGSSGNICTVTTMDGPKTVLATFTTSVGSGVCGTAATNYASSATAYSGTYCSTSYGNSSIPAFPAVGSSSNWYCKNSVGTNDAYCTATHVGCVPSCSPTTASTICSDQSFSDGCGGTCTGTRVCGSSWREVAP